MNSADCLLEENETQAVHGSTGRACRIIYCISKQCSNGAYFSQFVGGIVGSDPEECRGRASIAAAKQFRQNIRHGASCAGPRQRQAFKGLSIQMVARYGEIAEIQKFLCFGGPIRTECAILELPIPRRTDPFRRMSLRTKATAGMSSFAQKARPD
jgi:hypothetical protein